MSTSNGLGPWWFPASVRAVLTKYSALFFDEAAWDRHDEGYAAGSPDRATCDLKFLQAMLRDASRCDTATRTWASLGLAAVFWALVRLFGRSAYGRSPAVSEQ